MHPDDVRYVVRGTRISIEQWFPGAYDHDEGYHEIAHIKLSQSKHSFMDCINLEEIKSILDND